LVRHRAEHLFIGVLGGTMPHLLERVNKSSSFSEKL
jgi:hypothetical protein